MANSGCSTNKEADNPIAFSNNPRLSRWIETVETCALPSFFVVGGESKKSKQDAEAHRFPEEYDLRIADIASPRELTGEDRELGGDHVL